MKTSANIILIGFYLVNVSFVSGDEKNKKKAGHLEQEIGLIVYGSLLNKDFKLSKAEFKLYEGNDLVVSGNLTRKGTFRIPLYLSENYVLELAAPGYLPKRFYFNTNIPPGIEKLFAFGFSARLIREENVQGDIFFLDFPYALVKYDEKSYEFGFCEKYSLDMKAEEKNAISDILLNN